MSKTNQSNKVVVSFSSVTWTQLMQCVLITLKLTGTITWSWWWVLAPSWIPMIIVGMGGVAVFLYYRFHKPTPEENLARLFKQYGERISKN